MISAGGEAIRLPFSVAWVERQRRSDDHRARHAPVRNMLRCASVVELVGEDLIVGTVEEAVEVLRSSR
jgi:hypothetical protein